MSLEAALHALAESNLALATAITNHGKGITVVNTSTTADTKSDAKPLTAAEKKAAKKAEEEAAAKAADAAAGDDADPFADDAEAATTKHTAASIRALILEVRDIGGEKENQKGALAILTKLGVKTPSEIKESDFAKAAKLCQDALDAA